MLTLSSPGTLFQNKKIFHVNGYTDEKFLKASVILLYEYAEPELPEQLKTMAVKILQACQFKPEETVFVNIKHEKNTSLGAILKRYNPELILVFGNINPSRNIAALKKNIPYTFGNLKLLRAESFDYLEKNPPEKQALWLSLKKMLGL